MQTLSCGMQNLSCSMQTLSCGMHVGSSSPTRDQTRVPCIGSTESNPLDHREVPSASIFEYEKHVTQICLCRTHYLAFSPAPSHLSPRLRPPCLSLKYPIPLDFREVDMRLVLPSLYLAAL